MDNYDGSVVIKTGLDTEGFVAGSRELARDAQKAADNIKNISNTARASIDKQIRAFARANDAYQAQEESVARLRDELVKLQQTKVETDEYKKVASDLESAESELDRLITKEQEYVALGKKDDSGEVQRLVYREGVLDDQISNLKARLQAMRDAGEQYRPADTSKAEERLSNAEAKRDSMLTKINDKYIELRERIRGAGREAEKTTGAIRKRGGINFKTILKYTLGIRSLFILFRRMRCIVRL